MEYRTLGRTGLRVSAVALGCEGFMHKRAEEVKADFDFAIGHGINFVDIYSSNPDLRADIGAALEGRRGEFIIQGHLCTVWENDQYLRTRDPQKSADSFERQLRHEVTRREHSGQEQHSEQEGVGEEIPQTHEDKGDDERGREPPDDGQKLFHAEFPFLQI